MVPEERLELSRAQGPEDFEPYSVKIGKMNYFN
jgi:hypothetical protein